MHGPAGASPGLDGRDDSAASPAADPAAIISAAADAIISTTPDGVIVSWNAAATRLFGWSATEMIGRSITEIVPAELAEEARSLRSRIVAGEAIESFDSVRLAQGGRPIEVSVTFSPVRSAAGGEVAGICAILRDVGRAKQAERGAAMLAAIIASSSDGVVSKTLHGIVTSWNKSAERIFGYSEAEMLNQSIRRIIPAERQDEEDRILAAVVAGEMIDNFETVRVRKDGARLDVSVTVSPVRDSAGRVVGASKIVRDITDKRQTREQLRVLLAEVNHRSKNLLSLVQAIARQMTRQGREFDLGRFLERLQALASNQDLLIQNDWRFIPLEDLVLSQLRSFGDAVGSRITLSGPAIELTPEAAQTLGITMHELTTNAAKYGALAGDHGHIDIAWSSAGGTFKMRWTERGGPPLLPPTRTGFGSRVVSDMVRLSLDADVEMSFDPTGLRWQLSCPFERISRGRTDGHH